MKEIISLEIYPIDKDKLKGILATINKNKVAFVEIESWTKLKEAVLR